MTQTLLDALALMPDCDAMLLDKRFSRSIEEIGEISLRKIFSAAWLLTRLLWVLIDFRPTHVVLFATNSPASFLVDVAVSELLRRSRSIRINYVHTVGFDGLAKRGSLYKNLTRRLFSGATVVYLTERLRGDLERFATAGLTEVPNTVRQLPARLGIPSPQYLLYMSNLLPEKGADVFVTLANDLLISLPNMALKFRLVGATKDPAYTDAIVARAQGAGDAIQIVGPVSEADRWELLAGSIVLVFPSTYPFEAMPLTILEAMAMGIPVVAYDMGGIADLVEDGETGFIVPVGAYALLRARVAEIVRSPTLRRSMSEKSMRRYNELYSFERYVKAWSDLLSVSPSRRNVSRGGHS